MPWRPLLLLIRVLTIFIVVVNLLAFVVEPSWYSGLLVVFGVLVVAVAFGLAFGQRMELRAAGRRRRQVIDTGVVWAIAACATTLAFVDPHRLQKLLWLVIAILTLGIESFYRATANRVRD
jgi:hypothetical protein